MKRREFLKTAAAVAGSISVSPSAFAEMGARAATLHIQADRAIGRIAPDFIGLSYETAQLKSVDFFSPANTQLIALLRGLSSQGVLRLGGDTSDYAVMDDGSAQPAPAAKEAVGPDKGGKQHIAAKITTTALQNLRGFLDATGWHCIFGLNLGKSTPQQCAEQAVQTDKILGNTLIAFQIGNEPDLFRTNGLRPESYGYEDFIKEWVPRFQAVRGKLPSAQFAGPAVAGTSKWLEDFARQYGQDIMMLTSHYYSECPPTNPEMTIERMLSPKNPRFIGNHLPLIQKVVASSHLPYRLAETNSCCQGGKEGVSNTFASALWASDLMLQIATAGSCGINFHGGGDGWYTPIAGDLKRGFTPRPEYYGIFLVSKMLGNTLLGSTVADTASDGLLTTYVSKKDAHTYQIAVFNKHASQDTVLTIEGLPPVKQGTLLRLFAPHLDATSNVTFGGSYISPDGQWNAIKPETVSITRKKIACAIPRGSAALITLS